MDECARICTLSASALYAMRLDLREERPEPELARERGPRLLPRGEKLLRRGFAPDALRAPPPQVLAAGLLERLRLLAAAPREAKEPGDEKHQKPAYCVERHGGEHKNEEGNVVAEFNVARMTVQVLVAVVAVVTVVAVAAVEEGGILGPAVGGLAAAVAAVGGASVGHGGKRIGRWKTRRGTRKGQTRRMVSDMK